MHSTFVFGVLFVVLSCVVVQSQIPTQFAGATGGLDIILRILDFDSRYKRARLIEHPSTGKCMNIERALIGSGIRIIMYDCNWRGAFTPVNMLFYGVDADHGTKLLKGSASHSNMCLYTGNNHEDPLYTIGCNTGDGRQQWDFRKVSGDEYLLVQRSTGRCLRAYGRNNGAYIRATGCNADDREQRWRICNGNRNCN